MNVFRLVFVLFLVSVGHCFKVTLDHVNYEEGTVAKPSQEQEVVIDGGKTMLDWTEHRSAILIRKPIDMSFSIETSDEETFVEGTAFVGRHGAGMKGGLVTISETERHPNSYSFKVTCEHGLKRPSGVEAVFLDFGYRAGAAADTEFVTAVFAVSCGDSRIRPDLYVWEAVSRQPVIEAGVVRPEWTYADSVNEAPPDRVVVQGVAPSTHFQVALNSSDGAFRGGQFIATALTDPEAFSEDLRAKLECIGGFRCAVGDDVLLVSNTEPSMMQVEYDCRREGMARVTVELRFEPNHSGYDKLRFSWYKSCHAEGTFQASDAEAIRSLFWSQWSTEFPFSQYLKAVVVSTLGEAAELPDLVDPVHMGRKEKADDPCLVATLKWSPTTEVHAALPTQWKSLHVVYRAEETCEMDGRQCGDGQFAPRKGPDCTFDECGPPFDDGGDAAASPPTADASSNNNNNNNGGHKSPSSPSSTAKPKPGNNNSATVVGIIFFCLIVFATLAVYVAKKRHLACFKKSAVSKA